MRPTLPLITQHADALQPRLQRAHDGHKKPRLQMLYLLASGQAHTRQEAARLLAGHRHTLARGLAIYAAGGLEVWWHTYVPAGTPVSLTPQVLASLEPALRRPEGFASYEALRQWVARTHGVQLTDQTLYTLVRTHFKAKRKGARPSHTKKP
jgi:hypothetical protein